MHIYKDFFHGVQMKHVHSFLLSSLLMVFGLSQNLLAGVVPVRDASTISQKNRSVQTGLPVQTLHGELPKKNTRSSAQSPSSYTLLSLLARTIQHERLALDSSRNYHRMEIFAHSASEQATVRLTLGESQPVEIAAFNILGKRVMDIYTGEARNGLNLMNFDTSQLSQGMYICVVRGRGFKTAEKFLVSR